MKDLPPAIVPILDEILPALRQFCPGEYGVALGGAHAKGVNDLASDVDIYVFGHQTLPGDERARLVTRLPGVSEVLVWGDTQGFVQAGTDFRYGPHKVECWLRSVDYVSATVADCMAGVVRHDFVTWTVMGFYNHCVLSDLSKMLPVDDAYGILARWQAQVSVYPPRLRQSIIAGHLRAAKFWPENFHYRSAIARVDAVYVAGILQQVINNLVQVLFALNEVYFPGEKKLEQALERLPIRPTDFPARIRRLLFPGGDPSVRLLEANREELAALVHEVEALAAATPDGPLAG